MSKRKSKITIGTKAIKMACLQVLPGYENHVKERFEDACDRNVNIEKHIILKGIGNFDIILLYLTKDLGSNLREAGPLKYILKANLFLCFPYTSKSIDTIFEEIETNSFSFFCLLKINPSLRNYLHHLDESLQQFLDSNFSIFGSLGWNELLVIGHSNEIYKIYDELMNLAILVGKTSNAEYSVILKTLSFLGLNYAQLPGEDIIKSGFGNTIEQLNKIKNFAQPIIGEKKEVDLPTIEVTVKQAKFDIIKNYLTSKGFKVKIALGKRDLIAKAEDDSITWAFFLTTLFRLRYRFRKKVICTNTRLFFSYQIPKSDGVRYFSSPVEPYSFDYDEYAKIFGKVTSSNLANLFYTLNSLLQNPLCGNVYKDMLNYPNYIKIVGSETHAAGLNNEYFALVSRAVLARGAELRSYGTYETIEEVTGRFSEFRGGCQVSLYALELLPYHLLNRIDIDWMGFLLVSDEPKFYHVNEVINAPSDSVWRIDDWWALFHETAHIIIERKAVIVNENIPELRQFLTPRSKSDMDLVVELIAELLGFEIGFFGDYDLYFRLLWKHLNSLMPYQNVPITAYALRSFFVLLFECHFRDLEKYPKVSYKQFNSHDFLYEAFIKHIDDIIRFIGKDVFPQKEFNAVYVSNLIKDFYPYARYVFSKIKEFRILTPKNYLSTKNTDLVFDKLSSGQIWWDQIDHPEAVLYNLLKRKDNSKSNKIEFNTQIATIVSFWNQYSSKISNGT